MYKDLLQSNYEHMCVTYYWDVCHRGGGATLYFLKELSHPSFIQRAYKLVDRFTRFEGDYRW
jgi:hypothetical protein